MATAQREGGLYYVGGKAVDAEGKEIPGAPKEQKDTPPDQQPGGSGAVAPVTAQDLVNALANAARGAAAPAKPAKAAAERAAAEGEDEPEPLPTISDLPKAVSKLKTVDEVKAMQKRDERVSAEKIYDARIAELEAEK